METAKLIVLVRQAQNGDSSAFQTLYLDAYKSVYYLALRMVKNPNDAEDITQEVFISVQEKIAGLHEPAAFYKWINQITAHRCTNFMQRKRDLAAFDDEPESLFVDDNPANMPDKGIDDEATRQIILDVIDSLPANQRACILYYYYQQMTVAQISENLNVSENTVKSRLALGRDKIRAALEYKEKTEGIKLYGIPLALTPILRQLMQEFAMPDGVADRMWEKIAEGIGIAAGGTAAAATAASEAAKVGAKEAVKQGVKAKVVGGVTAAVAVVVVATVLLWPKPEPAVVVTPPPSSTPTVTQTPTPTTTPTPMSGPIVWQDTTIEAAVRAALEKDPSSGYDGGDVTPRMMGSLSEISIRLDESTLSIFMDSTDTKVENFAGEINLADLTYMVNISSFVLNGEMTVTGIDVLSGYTALAYVSIENCASITELPDLSNIRDIGRIDLANLPSLTSLPDVGMLYELNVKNCGITDLTDIHKMTGLGNLELKGIPISDISLLGDMPTLRLVILIDMPVSDISPLAALIELHTVEISSTDISDISIFTNMPNLTSLTLNNNKITDISPLAGMTGLQSLDLRGNPITDKSPLDALTNTQIWFE